MTNTQENKKCCGECAPNLYEQTHAMNFCQNPFCECRLQGHQQNQEKEALNSILENKDLIRKVAEEGAEDQKKMLENQEELKKILGGKAHITKEYGLNYSHYHCWDQEVSACGIPLEKHTQCCLCDTKPENQESYKWASREEQIGAWRTVKPLVERMKARYPKEVNIEGLEPALTSDISEIAHRLLSNQKSSLVEKVEKIEEAYWDSHENHINGECCASSDHFKKIKALLKRD